jgi:A/G-specific adenine glycosylase
MVSPHRGPTARPPTVSPSKLRALRRRLEAWGSRSLRSFTWRDTNDPYRVLVAELLLQRTRAEHVPPVYDRLLTAAPSLARLSRLPTKRLEAILRPLGLRKRVPLIRSAARTLVRQFGGTVPADVQSLRSLPGLGRYGANAVLSLAFDQPVPMVDGGVARVLRRVFSLAPAKRPTTDELAWSLAQQIVSRGDARNLNLALIDLSTSTCRTVPRCGVCPLVDICDWGRDESLHVQSSRTPVAIR